MHAFSIPWPCLDDSPKPQPDQKTTPKSNKTFAQALSNVCDIPLSQFPTTCVKGDRLSVEIPEEEYMAGMDACKHNLHGRIVWPKGATPLTVLDLKKKLQVIWKNLARWGITSLGKGYYEFCFSSLEDVRRVRSVVSWNLEPGYLKLFAWSGDFNPNLQRNTTAQVWVRLYGLSQEYWRPKILFAIASSIGTPICTDAIASKPMFERTFGQYARVLVDMDLSQTLRYKVLVERKGYAFFVDLDYENLPDFCTHCKMVGHYVEICKKLQNQELNFNDAETKQKSKPRVEKKYAQINKPVGVGHNIVTEVVDVDVSKHPAEGNISQPVIVAEATGESSNAMPQALPVSSPASVEHQNQFNILCDAVEDENAENNQHCNENVGAPNMNLLHDGAVDSDVSSQDSDFVDETQFHRDYAPAEDIQIDNTPERVQKDMRFLKDSWANIVDLEEQEAINSMVAAEEPLVGEEGFQVKTSKHQRKVQKKKIQSSKDSYATRSKVNQKPFK
jgi:hypothetical protein